MSGEHSREIKILPRPAPGHDDAIVLQEPPSAPKPPPLDAVSRPEGPPPPQTSKRKTQARNRVKSSPLRAIRAHCLWCCREQPKEVRLCPAQDCPLWPFRLGRGTGRKGLLRAIRKRCLDCWGGSRARIRDCGFGPGGSDVGTIASSAECALWRYRFGKRPRSPREPDPSALREDKICKHPDPKKSHALGQQGGELYK